MGQSKAGIRLVRSIALHGLLVRQGREAKVFRQGQYLSEQIGSQVFNVVLGREGDLHVHLAKFWLAISP